MTLSKIVSIVDSTEMRKGESRNSPSTLFAMNDLTNHIIADPNNFMQGNAMTTDNTPQQTFLQQIRNLDDIHELGEIFYLLRKHPNAFLLLTLIAQRSRFYDGAADGLKPGEAFIGDYEACGLTRQQYRTALNVLVMRGHVVIIENCRNRKKSTTGTTTVGTKVKLISSTVYNLNLEGINHPINHRPTTDQPRTKKDNKEKKATTSKEEGVDAAAFSLMISLGIEESAAKDLAKKFSFEQAQVADQFIKYKISIGKCDNPSGFFIDALKKGWKAPVTKAVPIDKKFMDMLKAELGSRCVKHSVKNNILKLLDEDVDLKLSISEIITKINATLARGGLRGIDYEEK